MAKLSTTLRRCLADAYTLRNKKGLHKTRAGWGPPDGYFNGYYHTNTVTALVDRGLLEYCAKRTVAHVTDLGARVHEELREQGR